MISFNKDILSFKIQEFIKNNLSSNISDLILKGIPFQETLTTEIINQIEAKNRSEKKLPTWFKTKNIYYPNKLNIEQTSSEATAQFKSNLISGDRLIDLTGGFGVDDFYFSKTFQNVIHCEINKELSEIVQHNYKQLEVKNITCYNYNGLDVLKDLNQTFDWIYVDPSRRHDSKGKVFLLNDCEPNIVENSEVLFNYSNHILIKTSPLLDISSGLNELTHVKHIYSVAVKNEVKELLWVLEKDYQNAVTVECVNIKKTSFKTFTFNLEDETLTEAEYSLPKNYLYEPNSAILKAGAFNQVAVKYNLSKLHKHSHLYTSENLMDFPGRVFKIVSVLPYNRKSFKKYYTKSSANVTTRNFPESVASIRKKLQLKDGGTDYLFFSTNMKNEKIVIHCKKMENL
ncbi:THUMP-like domain-containing protein [Aurantibacter aestuarii]|uniref:SAM-dependent methyltransferase n=1 Tax=Aurantibacter aestuarii TaxID=1266046 RepID=A0A2T1N8Y8_9FLAO|nr:class I SAM-dependent methyltransferase [Aurantibacter aestuarii]PSG88302.1 SAM-dependent methyltransferase [Aurantibacter aestuarii]